MFSRWFKRKKILGWSAVKSGRNGLTGVTVLAPTAAGEKPVVLSCAALADGGIDPTSLGAMAQQIAADQTSWVLCLDRSEYRTLVVPEPPVQPAEMEQSLRWALAPMIERPVDEVAMASMTIPTAEAIPNRPQQCYVIVSPRETIARHSTAFAQSKLALEAIDIPDTAQRNIAALLAKPDEGIGLLRVASQGVLFTVTYRGELYLDRYFEDSLLDEAMPDTEGENRAFERIALQVQRSLDFISRSFPFISVDRVLIAPLQRPMAIGEIVAQNVSVPVQGIDLAEIFDFSRTPELADEATQSRYFLVLGAALRFNNE